jgi:tetratricopeptide (TPR) repeat protein
MSQEIRVRFESCDGTDSDGRFRVTCTVAGNECGVAVEFAPFLSDADYENLRWYLEEYMDLPDGGAVVRAQGIEQQLHEWGRQLYAALFAAPENLALLKQLLAGPEPRELTIATDQSALLRLPWELLADDVGNLAQRLSVRRQLATPQKNEPRSVSLPLRMLYIVSRPSDTGFIDPRMTTKALFAALDPLGSNVRIDFCRPPTLDRMREMLREGQASGKPYHVVHFDGHGTFLPEAQIGALCFEEPDDGVGDSRTDFVRADELGNLLAKHHIPLVVLEACRSATVGKTVVFRSVAPRLIQAGVDSVLSMSHSVHVEGARILLDCFYRELVRGTTIGHAVAEARGALESKPRRWIESGPLGRDIALKDWFLPHLYQRGLDQPLLPRDATTQQPVRQYDLFLSHNHNDKPRVEALARLLSERHSLRVWLDRWKCVPGKLEPQCEKGIRDSRFTVVVVSEDALKSKWVAWEIDKHNELNPEGDRLIPIKFEPLKMPRKLDERLWVDFSEPDNDADKAGELASLIRTGDAEDARRRRGFRPPAARGETGAFLNPPQYGFQGRARELHELERQLRRHRGIVLHAMGGMGKTTLATEAALWWTRSGLFRDGACFISFEQFASADRVVQVLGTYLEGPRFNQLPAPDQRRDVIEFFQQRDVLMVWDNYESVLPAFHGDTTARESPYTDTHRAELAELFRDLTSGPGRGCLLVTCRPGETGLPCTQRMELHGLARPDSLWLLHRILERDGLTLSDPRFTKDKLDPLLRDLADHPLSLELVGPHLRTLTPEAIREDFGKLLDKFQQDSDQDRNRSLRASLEFSRRHLSPAARAALPWLGLFSGGVFEDNLLDVSQIEPAAWEPIRTEFQGIALLRTEDDILLGDRPFLHFHPTLAIASADTTLAEQPETRQRFIGVYLALMQALDKALKGSQSRAALEILNREEANYRTAVRWAVSDKQHQAAAGMGTTFRNYLQMSGRLRERDAWVQWLRDVVTQAGFTAYAADYQREHAWTLFTGGDPQGAVDMLQALVERLRHTKEFDPAFQLANTIGTLGDMLTACGAAAQAIPILREAIGHWEALVERTGGLPWEKLLATSDHVKAAAELGNLSGTMGNLANALGSAGQHDEALAVAEKGVKIREKQGDYRNTASGNARCARILVSSGRYDEADAHFDLALAAARQAGDKGLEGATLQHQGILADERNQLDRATRLYQQALQRFQEAGNLGAMMRTYNLLGVVEQSAGRLAEARAWYEKSRELAVQLQDQVGLGNAAQNIGLVCQEEGEAARKRGDEPTARQHFEAARRSVEPSLRITQANKNKPDDALALSQLAQIHLLLGDLDTAERYAHASREIRESLGLKEAWKDYDTLAKIAEARGDTRAAAEWTQKRDDLLAELERRSGGGGGMPAQMLKALQQLAIACAQAGFGDGDLGPNEEESLATLEGYPAPLPDFAAHLRQLAAGQLPPTPASLPAELRQTLDQLAQAIREAQGGR